MSVWRAAFLASKILAIFFLSQTIISLEPIVRVGYAGGWELLILPGVLAALTLILWILADVIASNIARAASDWGADFAARHNLPLLEQEEDLTDEDTRDRADARVFARVNLGLAVLAVVLLILLLTLLIAALRGSTPPYRNFGLVRDQLPIVGIAAIVTFGIGVAWALTQLRRQLFRPR